MKRIVVAVAVLGLIATMGFAASNEVSSVNIVGYNVETVPGTQNFNLVSMQFDAFDPSFLGVFGTNQLEAGSIPQFADKVYLYDPTTGGYKSYGIKTGTGQFYDTSKFFDPNGATNPPLPSGTAMWVQTKNGTGPSKTITLAGEAVPDSTVTNVVMGGFNLMAYPFSSDRAINDTQLDELGTAGALPQLSDRLYVWNGVGYDIYGLKAGSPNQWYDASEFFTPGAQPTTAEIKLGSGFWYAAQGGGFTWVEPNPYLAAYSN